MQRTIRIVQPCPVDWSAMEGTGPRRYCAQCDRHVHDFSALTRRQIRRLMAGGRVCGMLRHDAQGRLITRPPLWKRIGARLAALSVLIQPGSCEDPLSLEPDVRTCEPEEMPTIGITEEDFEVLRELGYVD